jgi:hypothetical protein
VNAFVTAVKDDNPIHSQIAQGYQIGAMLKNYADTIANLSKKRFYLQSQKTDFSHPLLIGTDVVSVIREVRAMPDSANIETLLLNVALRSKDGKAMYAESKLKYGLEIEKGEEKPKPESEQKGETKKKPEIFTSKDYILDEESAKKAAFGSYSLCETDFQMLAWGLVSNALLENNCDFMKTFSDAGMVPVFASHTLNPALEFERIYEKSAVCISTKEPRIKLGAYVIDIKAASGSALLYTGKIKLFFVPKEDVLKQIQ